MNKITFKVFQSIEKELALVEETMQQPHQESHPDIEAALQHLLKAGGKRVRPALVILFGRMFDAPLEPMVNMAAAIELLHNATLVHDDFIDESLLRRGLPTLNAHWSPGATVLTGDYIFAKAAHLASEGGTIELMRLFASSLMTIVAGEVSQLFSSNGHSLETIYFKRIHAKTAALFTLSCEIGSRLGSVPDNLLPPIRTFGSNIGNAFQIIDDILDFSASSAALGKPVGGDLRRGIVTLPAIYFFESSPDSPAVRAILDHQDLADPDMNELVNAIRNSDALMRSRERASALVDEGVSAISLLPACQEKDALIELAAFIANRAE